MKLDDYLLAECIMNNIDAIEKEIETVKWMTISDECRDAVIDMFNYEIKTLEEQFRQIGPKQKCMHNHSLEVTLEDLCPPKKKKNCGSQSKLKPGTWSTHAPEGIKKL